MRYRRSSRARRLILSSIALCLSVLSAKHATAQEPVQQFLDGLRTRGYFDTAIDYIELQQQNPRLPEDQKQALGFERAMTLLQMSRAARTSGEKAKTLSRAQVALESFAKQFPNNALAARANSELGNILFERARAAVWQSDSPPPGKTKKLLLTEARQLIDQARTIYQRAYDQANSQLAGMRPPAVSDGDKEQEQLYREVQGTVLSNKLQLARCRYEEGQTWPSGSKKRKDILVAASEEFRGVHEKYRTWISGVYARVWQAKCFEELDDVATALGIYNEVLNHTSDDASVRGLQAMAKRFRLICLNHEKKKDYQLAVTEADAWLADRNNDTRTQDGVGIRWQKARAHDMYGQSMRSGNPERERQLRLALSDATEVSRYETAYKSVAGAMVRRLKVELGDRTGPPKSFDEAFELARTNTKKISTFKLASRSAKKTADRQKAREDLKLTLQKSEELLTLALQLADNGVEPSKRYMAQYLLSFVKYEQRKNYDAIVLARYVMKYAAKEEPETAMNAGDVAMAGCVQAFNDAGNNNDVEIAMLESISNEIINQWPESNRANEARMSLGMINHKANRPEEASKWYSAVPREAAQFGEAQLAAGQTWWQASLSAGRGKVKDPTAIVEMTRKAEQFLRSGLKAKTNPAGKPPESVTAAKLSLSQILNSRSAFDESIKLLTDGDQAVLKVIAVDDQSSRPDTGIMGKDFASLSYQVLLRAYVGTQRIDDALAAMTEMEKIGGPDTQIYVQLGQELEREIDRLKVQNDTQRLGQLRTSFEQFLSKVFERKDRQNYNSLIWVAETYRGLGQGMNDDMALAKNYFGRAADSYKRILDQKLVDEKRRTTVELRLVGCRTAINDFEGAKAMLDAIIAEHQKDLTAQFEACNLLHKWGVNGQPEKLNEAIAGSQDKTIWGWYGLGRRLEANPTYREKYFQSRLGMVNSRRQYALLGEPGKKSERLERAVKDIELLVSTQGAFEEPWWGDFDSLYQQLQRDQGSTTPQALEKPESFVAETPEPVQQETQDTAQAAAKPALPETVKKEPEGNPLFGLALALPVALIAAGGMWFAMAKPKKKSPTAAISQGPAPSFDGVGIAELPSEPVMPVGPPKKRQATSTTQQRSSQPQRTAKKKATTKRQLTPEEAAKRKALIARKKAAQAAQAGGVAPAKKKVAVKKRATADDTATAPAAKKKVKVAKKTPTKKPPEAS